jgi:hypothetical protein
MLSLPRLRLTLILPSYSLTCQLPAPRLPIASESACATKLYRGYSTTAEALVTPLSMRQRAKTDVLDQMFVPGTKESIFDSGVMAPIIEGTQGTGARVRLVGGTGAGVDAELADVIFPVRVFREMSFTPSILLAHKQTLHSL